MITRLGNICDRQLQNITEHARPFWVQLCYAAMSATFTFFFWAVTFFRGVRTLSCDFERGYFCGWRNPKNSSLNQWLPLPDYNNHAVCLKSSPNYSPEDRISIPLEYPNFIGRGELIMSYYMFAFDGNCTLNVKVGNKTVFSRTWIFPSLISMTLRAIWYMEPAVIDAKNETVTIEGVIPDKSYALITVDDLTFIEKYVAECPALKAPLKGSMSCTNGNAWLSRCRLKCERLFSDRVCLRHGVWSGMEITCEEPRVRLRYNTVELFLAGRWGKVCHSTYTLNTPQHFAQVVCRSLGFDGKAIPTKAPYISFLQDGWYYTGECNGTEKSLIDCAYWRFETMACKHQVIAAVICNNRTSCPGNCTCSQSKVDQGPDIEFVSCRAEEIPAGFPKNIPPSTISLDTFGVNFSSLNADTFRLSSTSLATYPKLQKISLSGASITRVPNGTFRDFPYLFIIELPWNRIDSLSAIEVGALPASKFLILHVGYNTISKITAADTKGIENANMVTINDNKIEFIESGAFGRLNNLIFLNLSSNRLVHLEKNSLPVSLTAVDINHNQLQEVSYDAFGTLTNLTILYLFNNHISTIQKDALANSPLSMLDLRRNNIGEFVDVRFKPRRLISLYLGRNRISNFSRTLFDNQEMIQHLDLSDVRLNSIETATLRSAGQLAVFAASRSKIQYIVPYAFLSCKSIVYLILDGNYLTRVSSTSFSGLFQLSYLNLMDNPIEVIEPGAFMTNPFLFALYLIGTNIQTLPVGTAFLSSQYLEIALSPGKELPPVIGTKELRKILRVFGYSCPSEEKDFEMCYPCLQGEYKVIGIDYEPCTSCPPGGFYQDSIAFVGELSHGVGCKQCPAGSYVSPAKAPGRLESECSSCPDGTDLTKHAGFRACPCLPGYFRLQRFGECTLCPIGYECSNETVNLRKDFYWLWSREDSKIEYQTFSNKLQEESLGYDKDWDSLNASLPAAYRCPFEESCEGGFNASCKSGYEGVLCGACSRGFYRMFSGCKKCPSTPLVIIQFVAVFLVLVLIALVIIFNKNKSQDGKRSLTDNLFGSLKIVIGSYQILSGTLNAYSYVHWPKELSTFMTYAEVLQLNILTIAPIECISDKLKADPYSGLLGYVLMDCAVIFTAFSYYNIRKMVLTRRNCAHDAKGKLFHCKVNCYRAVFLFLFITYSETCSKVFQALPAGCKDVCNEKGVCKSFFRSDYAVECFDEKYNKFVYFTYVSVIIPAFFPLISAFLLWVYCSGESTGSLSSFKQAMRTVKATSNINSIDQEIDKLTHSRQDQESKNVQAHAIQLEAENEAETVKDPESIVNEEVNSPILSEEVQPYAIALGLRFMYENYTKDCWYWEIIELLRKMTLTSLLAYYGQDNRFFLGTSAVLSGLYAVFFANQKPIPYMFEYWLHLGSLVALMTTQLMGMVLRLPGEDASVDQEADQLGITILLLFANVFVIVMIVARYIYSIWLTLKAVRANPQCSLGCIMNVLQIVTQDKEEQSREASKETKTELALK
ncbi:uncharacterized protein LOC5520597 [Nematostella vectensis]|uniref:uncharacterized protein LOC5520597 n=1 Tax=Nematostella vectensis TaxID=45351 RepID=UPI00207747C2|nr:uncharacterized protein LOC5520597 [Nematostella vectensis]